MIIEEAGEIVLKADPWVMCVICRGSGRTKELNHDKREPCWCCDATGFFLPPDVERAYQLLNAELPPKPVTPAERIAKVTSDFLKGRLKEESVTRRLFRPEKL